MISIEFFYGCSFAGTHYYLKINNEIVDDIDIIFGDTEENTKNKIIKYLKEVYDIDYHNEEIVFTWDGTL